MASVHCELVLTLPFPCSCGNCYIPGVDSYRFILFCMHIILSFCLTSMDISSSDRLHYLL